MRSTRSLLLVLGVRSEDECRVTGVRETVRTGGFEDVGGYARAVRSGSIVAVSGTAATGDGGAALFPGDVYRQTLEAFERALAALGELGVGVADVIRTRVYLTPGADWRRAVDAHRELFASVRPANTTLFVAGFIPEGVLVEVELDAVAPPDQPSR
jgi:enamine deaminase RidA (YjgF/YER057c/UK114 family)